MGLPFVVLNMVSAVLFKDMGVSDAQIAFWTSLIMWPWTIKFLWSPFLELFRSQKFFVVATQLVSGLLFGFAALALHLPAFFAVTVALFAVVAFSGATHDIAADGLYMSVLSSADQAKYIGWQGAFYNLAKLVATGGLVWFAGWLFERFAGGGAAETAAYRSAWTVVLCILGALMLLAGMWHLRILPQGHVAAQGSHSLREGLTELRNVVRDFFAKKGIGRCIAFIILYRLGEGLVMKIVPLFLKTPVADGGLGLTNQQIGLYYGSFGAGAFLLGSLLAGYYIAARGLRRALFCVAPAAVYVARGRRYRRRVLRLRFRIRRAHALHDAAGRPGALPHGALCVRFGYHEPIGHAHRHGLRFSERFVRLSDFLPRRHARHRPGVPHDALRPVPA